MRGTSDVLGDAVGELRDSTEIVSLLPERQAIFSGHPTETRDYPVCVVLTPISATSDHHRGAMTRRFRLQATVAATYQWRETQEPNPGGLTQMYTILDRVADRLDWAHGLSGEIPLGDEGGPAPFELEDDRLAVQSSWRVMGTYDDTTA